MLLHRPSHLLPRTVVLAEREQHLTLQVAHMNALERCQRVQWMQNRHHVLTVQHHRIQTGTPYRLRREHQFMAAACQPRLQGAHTSRFELQVHLRPLRHECMHHLGQDTQRQCRRAPYAQ